MVKHCPDCENEMDETDMSSEHANHVCQTCAPDFVIETLKDHGLL